MGKARILHLSPTTELKVKRACRNYMITSSHRGEHKRWIRPFSCVDTKATLRVSRNRRTRRRRDLLSPEACAVESVLTLRNSRTRGRGRGRIVNPWRVTKPHDTWGSANATLCRAEKKSASSQGGRRNIRTLLMLSCVDRARLGTAPTASEAQPRGRGFSTGAIGQQYADFIRNSGNLSSLGYTGCVPSGNLRCCVLQNGDLPSVDRLNEDVAMISAPKTGTLYPQIVKDDHNGCHQSVGRLETNASKTEILQPRSSMTTMMNAWTRTPWLQRLHRR